MKFIRAVIVGSGSSASTPSLRCVLSETPCKACMDAVQNEHGPNSRLNPCFLIQLCHPHDKSIHNILIDCGKTFRQAALKTFPTFGVRDLSAVLLTHDHADACFGIDDLREFVRNDTDNGLDIFADVRTTNSMQRAFSYLFPSPSNQSGGRDYRISGGNWTALLDWHHLPPLTKCTVQVQARLIATTSVEPTRVFVRSEQHKPSSSWSFVAIPVLHGPNYYSNGFIFRIDSSDEDDSDNKSDTEMGKNKDSQESNIDHTNNKEDTEKKFKEPSPAQLLLYISDISHINEELFANIEAAKRALLTSAETSTEHSDAPVSSVDNTKDESKVPPNELQVLVLDMLAKHKYISHLCVDEAISLACRLNAKRTYFIGLSHWLEHHDMINELVKRSVSGGMTIGYDGCCVAEASQACNLQSTHWKEV